jgi:phospholipid:diacylglycerol acyltransferase
MESTLRRRVVGNDTPSESSTPRDESPDKPEKASDGIKTVHHHRPKTRKRRNTAIFLLGSLFGIIAAGFFAKSNDLIDFPEIGELSMDSFLDVLPAGLVKDMRELVVSRNNTLEKATLADGCTLDSRSANATFLRATTPSR